MTRKEKIWLREWPQPEWAVGQVIRQSGIVENICEHGVGHPHRDWLRQVGNSGDERHLCDSCCREEPDVAVH